MKILKEWQELCDVRRYHKLGCKGCVLEFTPKCPEEIRRCSTGRPSQAVLCVTTGEKFLSKYTAAKDKKIPLTTFYKHLKKGTPAGGLEWKVLS